MKKTVTVPYAYQNGQLNLVRPLILEPSDRGLNSAARAAFESEKIQQHTAMRVKAVIDVRRGDKADDVAQRVTAMFEDSGIQVFSRQRLDELLRVIDNEAHTVSEPD
jgi:hypothetical protein